ncbi:hypothetical protein HN873_058159 [Arachis hypogaea]
MQASLSEGENDISLTRITIAGLFLSATELKEAGVKFEVKKASQCLLDLQLSGHTLRIPFFRVEDITEVVLRNLLAFEQCHCINESYFADYIAVLDFLINTDKDVDLLIKNGIIENWLGDSNAVAKMFNGLGVNIMYPDFSKVECFLCTPLEQKSCDLLQHSMQDSSFYCWNFSACSHCYSDSIFYSPRSTLILD